MIEIKGVKLYDTQELCNLFGVTPQVIGKYRKKGLLNATRVGRKMYTSEDSIRNYLNGNIYDNKKG